ncbi:MAG TPA: N-acetylmuramoyl-L-alanine amidase [Prolixibacteraceae bacterium]|nr:N-acetylmuramoyl-L-alanine amidase [Prolixibacteraceae bacterium]
MRHIVKPAYFTSKLNQILIIVVLLFPGIPLSAQEYPTIKAKKGDGIYTILKQNGYSPNEYLDQFIELNKTNLGKENTLIIGRIYRLPIKKGITAITIPEKPSPAVRFPEIKVYEIFGTKYREVQLKSSELKDAVYYLVSGHGGPDPGAVGKLNGHILCEDEYAYDVTLRLALILTERGATVYMIIRDPNDGIRDEQFLLPDKDEVCYPGNQIPLGQLARLRQETSAVNKLHTQNKGKFQRMVVIHVDSRSTRENIDVFFYHDKGSSSGKKLANTLKQTFEKKYATHQPNRGYDGSVSERNLYVIKNSNTPAVFIELGNINHTRDQKRFIISDNRQAVANWLRDGLMEDYKKTIK